MKKRTYRVSVSLDVTVPSGTTRAKLSNAIRAEWWLDNLKGVSAKLPLGKRDGYQRVVYGPATVRSR